MPHQFSRLVCFEDSKGHVHYGEVGKEWQKELVGQIVRTYDITDAFQGDYRLAGEKVEIAKASRLVT